MREPLHELPCVSVDIIVSVIHKCDLYIRIAVRRDNLGNKAMSCFHSLSSAYASRKTDDMFLSQIQEDRCIRHLPEIFLDYPGLFSQLIIEHGEPLFRDNDRLLKIYRSDTDAIAHEITVRAVPVPESFRFRVHFTAGCRINIAKVQISAVLLAVGFQSVPYFCEIFAVS